MNGNFYLSVKYVIDWGDNVLSMSLGRIFFRDTNDTKNGRKQYTFTGKIWIPADYELKPEHLYLIVGSEIVFEAVRSLNLQVGYESAQDMSEQTKKKDLNKVLPLIHAP